MFQGPHYLRETAAQNVLRTAVRGQFGYRRWLAVIPASFRSARSYPNRPERVNRRTTSQDGNQQSAPEATP